MALVKKSLSKNSAATTAEGTLNAGERERLGSLLKVVDENLVFQLQAINRSLDSIRDDLPFLKSQKNAKELMIQPPVVDMTRCSRCGWSSNS